MRRIHCGACSPSVRAVAACRFCVPLVTLCLVLASHSAADSAKIGVNVTGICRVTGTDLEAAGVDLASTRAERLALTCSGEPVACRVAGPAEGPLRPDSAVLFYGEALNTPYTDTNVYWLSWDGDAGPRMEPLRLPAEAAAEMRSYRRTLHFEQNRRHAQLYTSPDSTPEAFDGWVWETIRPDRPLEAPVDLPSMVGEGGEVVVKVVLRGRTTRLEVDPDHHAVVEFSGHVVGDVHFDGQTEAIAEGRLASTDVHADGDSLTVRLPGDTPVGAQEQVYLDWFGVTYDCAFVAEEGRLTFGIAAGAAGVAQVTGLGEGVAEVYAVGSPRAPRYTELGDVEQDGVRVPLAGGEDARYVVTTTGAYLAPSFVVPAAEASLRSTENGADFVVVAYDDFCEALEPLVRHREEQGYRVAVVPVSRVYDEFSDGVFTPVAIRDFLKYAYDNWERPAPRYVLLVGDASYDYRGYLNEGVPNYVPAFAVPVAGGIATTSDAYFACVDGGDHATDMAIGRLPVSTVAETEAVVAKILRYEQAEPGDWQGRAVFVADHEGTQDVPGKYEAVCQELTRLVGEHGLAPTLIPLRDVDPALPADERTKRVRDQLTPRLIDALTAGTALVEFQGHGNERFWSRQKILTLDDVGGLARADGLPVFIDISCFTGWFDKPDLPKGNCLAEALLLSPESGAIACIAPSALGGLNLDVDLVPRLVEMPDEPIGVALQEARRAHLALREPDLWDPVENYNLLGDPLLRIRWPEPAKAVAATPEPTAGSPPAAETQAAQLAPATMRSITAAPGDQSRPEGHVDLPGGRIDTRSQESYREGGGGAAGGGPRLFVIQFLPDRETEGKRALDGAAIEVLREAEERAAIVRMTAAQADAVSHVEAVQWMSGLLPWFKVPPPLMQEALVGRRDVPVVVGCATEADAQRVREVVAGVNGKAQESTGGGATDVVAEVPASLVVELARDEGVLSITRPGVAAPEQPEAGAQ